MAGISPGSRVQVTRATPSVLKSGPKPDTKGETMPGAGVFETARNLGACNQRVSSTVVHKFGGSSIWSKPRLQHAMAHDHISDINLDDSRFIDGTGTHYGLRRVVMFSRSLAFRFAPVAVVLGCLVSFAPVSEGIESESRDTDACEATMIDATDPELGALLSVMDVQMVGAPETLSYATPEGKIVKVSSQQFVALRQDDTPRMGQATLEALGLSEEEITSSTLFPDFNIPESLIGGLSCAGSCTGSSCGVRGCDLVGQECTQCSCYGTCDGGCTCTKTDSE